MGIHDHAVVAGYGDEPSATMVVLSIIVPAYNEERYIGACINSISSAMKDYNHELIVVDNGSTDKTWAIARDSGVRLFYEPTKGVVHARQKGLDHASGEFVAFIDADARMPLLWWAQAQHWFNDPNIAAVSGVLQFYDGTPKLNQLGYRFYAIAKLFHRLWPTLQGGNCVIRRSALIDALDRDYSFWGEDTAMASNVAKYGKIVLDSDLVMWTSARRLDRAGYIKTAFLYVINYLSVSLFGRPATRRYKDYR